MPQSLSKILIHVIFSTKDRHPFLTQEIRPELHAYLATLARNQNCECYRSNGVADHVHLAIGLSRTITIADLIKHLKTESSKWLKPQDATLEKFAWQKGYGAFSLGMTQLPKLLTYIDHQEEHHKTTTFQEEYRIFLDKYNIEYDERYVWD
ncbi:IS200/IS605 family transposase [Kiritimatiellota bacterium B12222]|nr:IS200/IS605 family transposase [Kiritimatiellota bacterium B12222]